MRILVVEDDNALSGLIAEAMRQAEYAVDQVHSGADADKMLREVNYDLVILDLGLPGMDGLEVLRNLRSRKSEVPVIILTARDRTGERIAGLDLGADDYMAKPFDLPELEARVRALIRRRHLGFSNELIIGSLRFDITGRRVFVNDQPVDLLARELGVLEVLLRHAGRVVSKEQLLEQLYSDDEDVNENAIEVYIHRLRKKLTPEAFKVRTIRGLGYLVEQPA